MSTYEIVLTYIGAVLIAMEFIRKFTKLQALMGMLVGWPVSSFFGDKGLKSRSEIYEIYKKHKLNVIFRVIISLILCIISLPLTVVFYVIWFIVSVLNSFHYWVNRLYSEGIKRYNPFYLFIIRLALFAHKTSKYEKYANLNERKVMSEIEKEIPVLPIIGVILISIAFVLVVI